MRVGFLLNHYAPHQLYHSVPIALALSQLYPDIDVTIMASQAEQLKAARGIGTGYSSHHVRFARLHLPFWLSLAAATLGKFMSVNIRKGTLRANLGAFQRLDVLVVPEKNSLSLKREPTLAHLKFVRIRHGAGDREVGLDESSNQFDLILASGQKMIDRLTQTGVPAGRCRIVGYPKFDAVQGLTPPRSIFSNGKPTVIYNPHFKPNESSWPGMGLEVLEFFRQNKSYNLIFAPHIMLYKRGGRRHGARNLWRYRFCKNIHIDTGSLRSVNMTYTRQADIYLGDVSSQIYEFLQTPRPCIFLNAHHVDWQDDVNFTQWKTGQVIDDVKALSAALQNAIPLQEIYRPVQEALFAYTFNITPEPSANRAARAIAEYFSNR